jgi:site-specific DNA-methyltransferase (adenine-specific)
MTLKELYNIAPYKDKYGMCFNDDCLERMKDIPDKSIDMILCDLPYGTTACKWDIIIPFEPLWKQYNRIIKDNSVIILFGSQPFTTIMINSNIKNFKEELIWVKNNSPSGLLSNKRHLKIHEDIIVFSNNGTYNYNPQKWYVNDEDFITKRKTLIFQEETNRIIGATIKGRKKKVDNGSRNPISILPFKIPYSPKSKSTTKNGDYRLHPTQKPVALLEYLIKTYTNEGMTVLDNCMGSGSTCIACINTNRKYIGIEKDEKYFKIATDRIKNHLIK